MKPAGASKSLVSEDQLSLAIGKRGQNARLTSKLTGWQVDITPKWSSRKAFEEKVAEAVELLATIPGISPGTGRRACASWPDPIGRFAAGGRQ